MNVEGLKSFLAVAKEKSISKAARSLHLSQPALSTRLQKMEEGLGFPLVERNWDGIKLTKQGFYFLPYAVQMLQEMNSASTVLTDYSDKYQISFEEVTNHNDQLLIGIDEWLMPICLEPIVNALQEKHPDLSHKFIIKSTPTIRNLLEYKALHIGVFYNNSQKNSFPATSLIEDEMVLLYYAEQSLIIENDLSNINLLQNKTFILFDNPMLTYHDHITKNIIELLSIEDIQIVNHINVMLTLVAKGDWYTIVPKSSVYAQLNQSDLPIRVLPLGRKIPTADIQIAIANSVISPITTIKNALTKYFESEYAIKV